MRSAWLLVLVPLAGCVADEPTAFDPAAVDWDAVGAAIYEPEHEHVIRELHEEQALGVTPLARSTLYDDGMSHGMYSEADVMGDVIAVAVVTGASGADLDVILLDRGALPDLVEVGRFSEPGAYGDVKLDPERPWAYVAYPGVRVTGSGAALASQTGLAFSIWDISDPAAPARIGEARGPGCHMLNVMHVGGAPYVWCTSTTGAMSFRIEEVPGLGVVGVPVHTGTPQQEQELTRQQDYYSPLTDTGVILLFANHDMTAQPDPLTGDPVMVSAHEINGIRIFDVATPELAVEVGRWVGEGHDRPIERVHTAGLFDIDGRRIAIGSTETYWRAPPEVYFVDFTDHAAPQLLSVWTPPGIPDDDGGMYSTHNFQVVGTKMYLSNFHAGTWVLDISDPTHVHPLGLRKAVWDTGFPYPERNILGESLATGQVWDVLVVDGYVITTDIANGVEVFAADGDPMGDPAWTGSL